MAQGSGRVSGGFWERTKDESRPEAPPARNVCASSVGICMQLLLHSTLVRSRSRNYQVQAGCFGHRGHFNQQILRPGERNKMKRRKDGNMPDAFRRKRRRPVPSHFWSNDPLNLREITGQVETPKSSPLPTPKYKQEVEVLIPANIRDPLNLTGQLSAGSNSEIASPLKVHRSRQRRKKKKKNPADGDDLNASVDKASVAPETTQTEQQVTEKKVDSNLESNNQKDSNRSNRYNRFHTRPNNSYPRKANKKRGFKYGNFDRYYGYRNAGIDDPRLSLFKPDWFEGRDVLDIGCNNGQISLAICQKFKPRTLKGVDIDVKLINFARKSLTNLQANNDKCNASKDTSSSTTPPPPSTLSSSVTFVAENYVVDSDEDLDKDTPQFDTIVCLSVTKWVHLNWGDDGLKRLFKRVYRQLRPGGLFILEPQPWDSYCRNKRHKISDEFNRNFKSIQLLPNDFPEYLVSPDVGFASCDLIDIPNHISNGFKRPIYKLVKPTCTTMSIESA